MAPKSREFRLLPQDKILTPKQKKQIRDIVDSNPGIKPTRIGKEMKPQFLGTQAIQRFLDDLDE